MKKQSLQKLEAKVEKQKQSKQLKFEQEQLSEFIAKNLDNTLGIQLKELAEGIFSVNKIAELLVEELKKKKTYPEIQEIIGKIKVENPKDFKIAKQKVEVVGGVKIDNQVDLTPLRDGIREVLKIASDLMMESSKEHKEDLSQLVNFLYKSLNKQNTDLLRALGPLQFLSDKPYKPISVRLTDGEKFYKAIARLSTVAQNYVPAGESEHNQYKASDFTATGTEQEIDLGGIYTSLAVSNSVVANIELKINSSANDPIILEKQGKFIHSNFRHEKLYLRSQGGNTQVTIFSSRAI